jgi:CRP-like cAMP-binding protein
MEPFQQPLIPVPSGSTTSAMSGAFGLLRGLKFFSTIGDDDLKAVAALMREKTFQPGEFIFRQNMPTEGLHVIAEGEIQLWSKVADAKHNLPRLGPGHVVSEASVVTGHSSHVNAEVLRPTRTWLLDTATFETLMARNHPAAHALLISAAQHLTLTMRSAFKWFGIAADHPADPDAPRPFDATPLARAWGPAEYPLMRVLPVFKSWSDDQLSALSQRTQIVELPRGHRLLGEGQPHGGIWLVIRGALEVTTTRPSGKFRHGIRGPGLIVGHEAVSDGGRQFYDVTVKETATLLSLPGQTLDELAAGNAAMAGQLLSHVCACVGLEFSADCKHFVKVLAERDAVPRDATMDAVRGSPLKD